MQMPLWLFAAGYRLVFVDKGVDMQHSSVLDVMMVHTTRQSVLVRASRIWSHVAVRPTGGLHNVLMSSESPHNSTITPLPMLKIGARAQKRDRANHACGVRVGVCCGCWQCATATRRLSRTAQPKTSHITKSLAQPRAKVASGGTVSRNGVPRGATRHRRHLQQYIHLYTGRGRHARQGELDCAWWTAPVSLSL